MVSAVRTSQQPAPFDITKETLIGLPAAARRLPPFRNGRPVSPSTVWRWINVGVHLADSAVVRLEAVRLGGRWLTSLEALARFAAAQTPDRSAPKSATSTLRTPAQRRRASERAEKELVRRGV